MSRISDILSQQVESAVKLINRAKGIPDGNPSPYVMGFMVYNKAYTRPLAIDVDSWETETREILRAIYGEESRQQSEFQGYWAQKNHYMDFREDIQNELKECSTYLNALIKVDMMEHVISKADVSKLVKKTPKVFISHKQEDKPFAEALVSLISFIIGPSGDKVFCSSIPGYGIRQSRDIIDDLKAQFEDHNIFMVIIHSPRYYNSTICLNEMGASWVLGTKFSSFMTKDCTYDLLKGVIGKEKICININEERGMLNAHLNDFKNDLLSFFGLGTIDENKWEHARDRFVKEVSMLSYDLTEDDSTSESYQDSGALFSDKENAILKKWVGSNSIEGHVVSSKDGTSFILGQDSYDVKGARDLMKWNDFMERMEKAKFIIPVRTNQFGKVYQLTEAAFDYIDSLS